MSPQKAGTILSLIVIFSLWPSAKALDLRTNWREECRSAIAGRFLSYIDDIRHQEDYTKLLTIELKKLRQARESAEQNLKEATTQAAQGEYSTSLEERRDTARFYLRTLSAQILENERQLAIATQSVKEAEQEASSLKPKMLKVFEVVKIPANHRGGYSFRVDYLSPCPTYQLLCPLPESQAQSLLNLLPKEQLPIACQRYAQIKGRRR